MIEASATALLVMAAIVAACSVAGLLLSRALPWADAARAVRLPAAAGLALGPFVFSFAGMLALAVMPGAAHATHLIVALVAVAMLGLVSWLVVRRHTLPSPVPHVPLSTGEWLLAGAILLVALGLLFVTLFVPLTQNDALEYATVGRELFRTGSLASYPVLDPATNGSGFVGPWTHPPLYVTAIYLADTIQGHADAPGLLRLISPWFAITGAGVVASVGAMVSRAIGLTGALILLSTPLLFLGAGSALLDALYISGFALVGAALLGARPAARGALVGGAIGIALWTHSVAVLFIPLGLAGLALIRGLSKPRALAGDIAVALAAALAIGVWHYWRNVAVFGALVSDNPAVFALPSLHWSDYFVINRGLDTPSAMIQYGILKGWFAFEAFALTYWGMAAGFVLLLFQGGLRPVWQAVWRGIEPLGERGPLYVVFGLLAVYLLGATASVLLGLDIMVKNERYLLAIQAVVALGAGYGWVRLVELLARLFRGPRGATALRTAACGLVGLVLLAQCLVFVQYALGKNGLGFSRFGAPFAQTLAQVPDYELTGYLRDRTPAAALVLSLKPADMYYAGRRMVSYLDPRLIPFYAISDPTAAAAELRKLGVAFVHLPGYGIPPLYNSALWQVLRDPASAELVFVSNGGQIYALRPSAAVFADRRDITPGAWPWYRETLFILGGRKRIGALTSEGGESVGGEASRVELPLGLFQRNLVTRLVTGGSDTPSAGLITVQPGSLIALDLKLSGHGLVALRLQQHDASGAVVFDLPLTSFELSENQPSRTYGQQVRLSPWATHVAVVLEQQGQSELKIDAAAISFSDYAGDATDGGAE